MPIACWAPTATLLPKWNGFNCGREEQLGYSGEGRTIRSKNRQVSRYRLNDHSALFSYGDATAGWQVLVAGGGIDRAHGVASAELLESSTGGP